MWQRYNLPLLIAYEGGGCLEEGGIFEVGEGILGIQVQLVLSLQEQVLVVALVTQVNINSVKRGTQQRLPV